MTKILEVNIKERNGGEVMAQDWCDYHGYCLISYDNTLVNGDIEISYLDPDDENGKPISQTITLGELKKLHDKVEYVGYEHFECESKRNWDNLTADEKEFILKEVIKNDEDLADFDLVYIN